MTTDSPTPYERLWGDAHNLSAFLLAERGNAVTVLSPGEVSHMNRVISYLMAAWHDALSAMDSEQILGATRILATYVEMASLEELAVAERLQV
jgi:hypothetical protein